jgi:hypothetical protein
MAMKKLRKQVHLLPKSNLIVHYPYSKERASGLLQKLMTTTLQYKDKGITIIGMGGASAYSYAKSATEVGKGAAIKGVEGVKYYGSKGYEYGKGGAAYASKKGYDLGAGAYKGVTENETVRSVVGEVYGKAVGVGGLVKGYFSKAGGAAQAPAQAPADGAPAEGEEPAKEESSAIPVAKINTEEKKEEQAE